MDTLAHGGFDPLDYGSLKGWTPIGRAVKTGNFEAFAELVGLGASLAPQRLLPHVPGAYPVGNPLLALADKAAAKSHDDRILRALMAADVEFSLERPVSSAYKNLAAVQQEAKALAGATTMPGAKLGPADKTRL